MMEVNVTKTICDLCGKEITQTPQKVKVWVWADWENGEQSREELDMCMSCAMAYESKMRDASATFIMERQHKIKDCHA